MKDKFYLVGKIINTHGIKGEMKVKADTSFDRFKKGNKLYIKKGNEYITIIIDTHRVHKGFDLITFNGIKDINDCLIYKGLNIYTTHDEKLEDGMFYYEDLIGKKIIVDGKEIGYVEDIRELPQGILLEVNIDGATRLIPFVDEFIKDVNDDFIIVTPIEGLL